MILTFTEYTKMMPLSEMMQSRFQTNTHNEAQIKALAKSMLINGVTHPISISNQTNTICFGHARKAAALLNGWTEYPVIFHTFKSDDHESSHVTSDNAIALRAELDFAKINVMIGDLDPSFDIDLMGIENLKIDVADNMDVPVTKEKKKNTCPQCEHIF